MLRVLIRVEGKIIIRISPRRMWAAFAPRCRPPDRFATFRIQSVKRFDAKGEHGS
ncbi:hypothetical protein J2853_000532 [Streptosporangium lutulentum]|uniref:DUF397 domain-containing protein n=1 Tax=Streptosporangium lutulentum TaxID=1461250 RepID=A0ABT9Q3L3_9ACTN|nr:hypothetical protein [Streptosporangium lutulentum]